MIQRYSTGRAAAVCGLAAALALSGCSSASGPGGQTTGKSNESGAAGPAEISLLLKYYSTQPPSSAEAFEFIQKHTNTKLNIIWAPSPSYDEKVNTTLASGNLPNVMLVTANKADNIVNAVRAGAFWELGPYLKDFPNLTKTVSEQTFYNVSYDGKIFSIPSLRNNNEGTVIIRKDWLDQLGLPVPATLDQLTETIKAFKDKDPDRNGKQDTVGLVENNGASFFHSLAVWMGAPNKWGVQDGKLVPSFMTKPYLDAMNYMRDLYAQKYINEDFAVVTQNQQNDYINKGTGGLFRGAFAMLSNGFFDPLAKNNPKAVLTLFDNVKGPSGDSPVAASNGFNGVFMIPKSSVKTEQQLRSILSFFDKMCEDEIRKLIALGIEGKHYKMENGKPVVLDAAGFSTDIVPLRWIMVADGITDHVLAGLKPTDETVTKVITDKSLKLVYDPTVPFVSKIIADQKIIDDARTKYILGQTDGKGWDDAIQKWRSSNGDTLIQDYNEQYRKSLGK